MVRRTARNDIDPLQPRQHLARKPYFGKIDLSVLNIGADRILDCLRLLVDLLQHKMLVPAFFSRFRIPLDLHHIFAYLFPVDIIEMDLIPAEFGNLQISYIKNISRLIKNRGNIGCNEASRLIFPDDERTVLSRRKEPARAVAEHHAECI